MSQTLARLLQPGQPKAQGALADAELEAQKRNKPAGRSRRAATEARS